MHPLQFTLLRFTQDQNLAEMRTTFMSSIHDGAALNEVLLLSLMVRWFDEGLMSVRKPSSVFDCFWFQNGAYKLNELWRPD